MKVIPPITIDSAVLTTIDAAMLTNSNAAEPGPGETAWSVATAYTAGQTCYLASTHRIYECLVAHTGASPDVNLTGATPKWLQLGFTNRWAMWDLYRDTSTVLASPLTVVITPGQRINSLALMGLVATGAEVVGAVGAATVYSRSIDLNTREVLGWYDYFFAPFSNQPSLVLFDIPPYSTLVLTITLTNTRGDVECGGCVVGNFEDIGKVQYEAESDTLNFSTVTRDFDGSTSAMVPRRNVPRTLQNIICDKARVNRVRALRTALGGRPAVWAGLDTDTDGYFEALLIVGFYKRFSINLKHPRHAAISLELEEI